jgi:hypothetical protein
MREKGNKNSPEILAVKAPSEITGGFVLRF